MTHAEWINRVKPGQPCEDMHLRQDYCKNCGWSPRLRACGDCHHFPAPGAYCNRMGRFIPHKTDAAAQICGYYNEATL